MATGKTTSTLSIVKTDVPGRDVTTGAVGEHSADIALSVRDLSKSFGPTLALKPFDLDVPFGQIHALLGENGSGKSTFIKSLSGYHHADSGEVYVGGEKLTLGSAVHAHALGCRFVHQDLGLIGSETVLDNLNIGAGGYITVLGTINGPAARRRAAEDLARVGLDVDPRRVVKTLSPAQQTAVAVARALRPDGSGEPKVLVLDEPTARLPKAEVDQLLETVRQVARTGVAVIYVSHRLEEVFKVAEIATILRDGERIATRKVADLDHAGLVDLLVGGAFEGVDVEDHTPPPVDAPVVLRVQNMTSVEVTAVDLEVREGEVIGIAGITGSGRESILSAVFGGTPRATGTVSVDGRVIRPGRPHLSIAAGIAYLPPDRKVSGSLVALTARENLMLADLRKHWRWPRLSRRGERRETKTWFARLNVKPSDNVERPLSAFSGGNQQKILFGKWLRTAPRVLLLDEPTQGVDVGTKAELHREILAAAEAGACVVVSSSDTEELIGLCHHILVMRHGKIVGLLSGKDKTVVNLSHTSFGTVSAGGAS